MALAARARGVSFSLAGKAESVIGTAPSGNWAKLPIMSFDLNPARPLVQDPALSLGLGRSPPPYYYDALTIKGTAVVPLDTGNFDFWATLLWGAVVTTGTGPHTDTYTAGGTPTTAAFEKGFVDVSDYWPYTGVYGDGFSLSFAPTGTAQLSVPLMGMGAGTMAGSTIAGTVTTAAYAALRNNAATLLVDAAAVGNITAGTIQLAHNMEEVRTLDSGTTGVPSGFDPGLLDFTADITARYDGNTIDGYARAASVHSLGVQFAIAGGFTLTFNVAAGLFEYATPTVGGPNGIEQKIRYKGQSASMFTAVRTRA